MQKASPSEILTMTRLLQMETNELAMAKASVNLVNDKELKTSIEAGINKSETRIKGIQQFISENNLITSGEVQ